MNLLFAQSTKEIFTTESFCLEYLLGATRLLEIQKDFCFPLVFRVDVESLLFTYLSRNILKILTLQILYKSSPLFSRTIESIRAPLE